MYSIKLMDIFPVLENPSLQIKKNQKYKYDKQYN